MARPRRSRAALVALASVLVGAAGLAACWWLETLPIVDAAYVRVLYFWAPYTAAEWGAGALLVACLAALALEAVVVRALFRRAPLGAWRTVVGVLGGLTWTASALVVAAGCLFTLMLVGSTHHVVTASDGTTLLLDDDGFMDAHLTYYWHRSGGEWVALPEDGRVYVGGGGCSLTVKDPATLTVACGGKTQDVRRP